MLVGSHLHMPHVWQSDRQGVPELDFTVCAEILLPKFKLQKPFHLQTHCCHCNSECGLLKVVGWSFLHCFHKTVVPHIK